MTSPVSAVDITAMMERVWVFRDANYQRRWIDKPKVGATEFVRAAEVLALARQAEALQRENAEKDARIARLRDALQFYATPSIYLPHPLGPAFDRRASLYHAAKDALSGARALLGGSENAE